jgi:hypothetical protein
VGFTPHQLRVRVDHCRYLAISQVDGRIRLILNAMAGEFDEQARVLAGAEAATLCGADSVC